MEIAELLQSDEAKNAIKEAAADQATKLAEEQFNKAASGLKSKNQELLNEVKKLKQFKSAVGDDFDPDEYKVLRESKRKAEEEKARQEGNWEKLKESLVEQHHKEVEKLNTEIAMLKGSVERYLIDSQIRSKLSEAGANVHLMEGIVKQHVRPINENGDYRIVVVDKEGNPRIGSSDGSLMTISQLIKEFSEQSEYAPAFPGTGRTGTGSNVQRGKSGPANKKISEMSDAEKADLITEIGQDAYQTRRRAGM